MQDGRRLVATATRDDFDEMALGVRAVCRRYEAFTAEEWPFVAVLLEKVVVFMEVNAPSPRGGEVSRPIAPRSVPATPHPPLRAA